MNTCLNCGKLFEPRYDRPNQTYCGKSCVSRHAQKGKPKKKGSERKKGSGGLRPGGGKSKVFSYVNWLGESMKLNKEEIEVAKILDSKKLEWHRNTKGFPYIDLNGNNRKFYPDFVINDYIYLEYKGWITEKMHHKMKDAQERNPDLNLTIVVGKDKRYHKFGKTLNELQDIFFEEIN